MRRNLDADIDRLGTWLKVINVALMPIVLTILALAVVVVRRRKQARAMSKRAIAIVAAALLVLLVLVLVGQRATTPGRQRHGARAGPCRRRSATSSASPSSKANGETVATLERRPDSWVVADKQGYAANVDEAAASADGARRSEHPRAEDRERGAPRPARRRGRRRPRTPPASASRFTAPGHELPTIILGNAEGSRVSLRAPRRRGAELPDRPQSRRPARGRAMGRRRDRRRARRARSRGHDHARRRRGGAPVEGERRARELRGGGRARGPRALVSRRRQRRRQRAARAQSRGRRARGRGAGRASSRTVVEYRTFDGLVVRITGTEKRRRELDFARGQRRCRASGADRAACGRRRLPTRRRSGRPPQPPIRPPRPQRSTPKSAAGATRSPAFNTTR